ncbi:MAG: dihydrodipicolinate synthase family protein [Planctomycetaceae bacterium]
MPRGIVSVVQTPFDAQGRIDPESLQRLVDDAIDAGVAGFLAPAVASEVAALSMNERESLLHLLTAQIRGRVPLIVGASSDDPQRCQDLGQLAEEIDASGWLVSVPEHGYRRPETVAHFFHQVAADRRLPLIVQDLQFGGPGLPVEEIDRLRREIPLIQGVKIETVPAGPKYTAIRDRCGSAFYIAGGWAVPQMIEALDRGVDAMIPESSMVRVYQSIYRRHQSGDRANALRLFRELLPILSFANQELVTSIAFFKLLLVRKGIFVTDQLRLPGFAWDAHNRRIAEELIEHYLQLEQQCGDGVC